MLVRPATEEKMLFSYKAAMFAGMGGKAVTSLMIRVSEESLDVLGMDVKNATPAPLRSK